MSLKVFIDGVEADDTVWEWRDERINIIGPVAYGSTISYTDDWEFGDVLAFRDAYPLYTDNRFMYLADAEDPSADDPIWVMALDDNGGWQPGHITMRNRRIFRMVLEA